MENKQVKAEEGPSFKSKALFSFGLFFFFFFYYMGVAILNTPAFKDIAAIVVFGMPLGMFTSLVVFPFSWLIAAIYFYFWR